jgi:hypothetical protein
VHKEADRRDVPPSQRCGHEEEVVVVDPHEVALVVALDDGGGEFLVRIHVRLPAVALPRLEPPARGHFAVHVDDVVEDGPERVLAVVQELARRVRREEHGKAAEWLEETRNGLTGGAGAGVDGEGGVSRGRELRG